mgnify:FL=1
MTPFIAYGVEGTSLRGGTYRILAFTCGGEAVYETFPSGKLGIAPVAWFHTDVTAGITAPPKPVRK